jgi:biopolymer transport protein ExbD
MGAAVGTGDKKSVNVDLNIVPFIDLMSCLTAFLLVTAAWVNIAQLDIRPKGKTRDTSTVQPENEDVTLSVLIQADKIWIGLSRVNEFFEIPKKPEGHDWDKYKETLVKQKESTFFKERSDIEIAAESTTAGPVQYQDIITAMDIAVQVKFIDVGLSDPAGLAARPTL